MEPITQAPQNEPVGAVPFTPGVYGVMALGLLGIASFLVVFFYFAEAAIPAPLPAAATASVASAFDAMKLEGKSAYIMDIETGRTLYDLNPDAQLPLASITKIALALAVSEVFSPEETIVIPFDTAPVGASERLARGETWAVQDVINFTLVSSSNEGADILARAANARIHAKYPESPADDATLWRMNEIAREIGLAHTYFLNPSGLDVSATQSGAYGSARDVALLMAYAATSAPNVFAGTAVDGLRLSDGMGNKTRAFNTNEALGDIPGLIMGKTGFTDLAGGNLAVVFDSGLAHPIVAVIMGASREGRFSDMKKLVEAARVAVTRE